MRKKSSPTLEGERKTVTALFADISRARLRARTVIAAAPPRLDEILAERIQRLIELYPTFGYRRLWAMLRFRFEGIHVRKAVYRLLMLKGWFVHQRSLTPRPWVHGLRSRAQRSAGVCAGPD
jgi:helix-turn-helix protein